MTPFKFKGKIYSSIDDFCSENQVDIRYKNQILDELIKAPKCSNKIGVRYQRLTAFEDKLKKCSYATLTEFNKAHKTNLGMILKAINQKNFDADEFYLSIRNNQDQRVARATALEKARSKAEEFFGVSSFSAWIAQNPIQLNQYSQANLKEAFDQSETRLEMDARLASMPKKKSAKQVSSILFKGGTLTLQEAKKISGLTVYTIKSAFNNFKNKPLEFDDYFQKKIYAYAHKKRQANKDPKPANQMNNKKVIMSGWVWSSRTKIREYYQVINSGHFRCDNDDEKNTQLRLAFANHLTQMRKAGLIGANNLYLPDKEPEHVKKHRPENFSGARLPPEDLLDRTATPDFKK